MLPQILKHQGVRLGERMRGSIVSMYRNMSGRMLAHCGLVAVNLKALSTSRWKQVLAIASFLLAKPLGAAAKHLSPVGNLKTNWLCHSRVATWKVKMLFLCSARSQLTQDMTVAVWKSRKDKMRSVVTACAYHWTVSRSSEVPTPLESMLHASQRMPT
jgi:hypothetical protein